MKVSRRLIGITGMRDIIERRIAVLTLDSKEPGPEVWLTACIHGDEAGGTAIVHDVVTALRRQGLHSGALRALPLINSLGFENNSRYVNADREDLNRCFPGNPRGSMGEQIARRLFDTIVKTKPDLVIDLHNDWVHSVPYILIEPPGRYPAAALRDRALAVAREAGLLLVEDSDDEPGGDRTLSAALVAASIPAFTMEAGGTCGIVEECVASGTAAVLAMLECLGMTGAGRAQAADPRDAPLLRYTNRPLCTTSGLVRFDVAPGDTVSANQPIARVYSAFGSREETLRARGPGIVLGVADHARVVPGSEVIAIARRGN